MATRKDDPRPIRKKREEECDVELLKLLGQFGRGAGGRCRFFCFIFRPSLGGLGLPFGFLLLSLVCVRALSFYLFALTRGLNARPLGLPID